MSGLRIKVGSQEETLFGGAGELPDGFTSVRIEKVPGGVISAETLSGTYAEAGAADVVIASADSPLQTGGAFHAGHGEVPDETPRTIGELMVFDYPVSEDAPDDAKKLEGYLAWKWGIQDQLPASHPYRNAAPEVVVYEPEVTQKEPTAYRSWLPRLAPEWLADMNGHAWLWANGDVMDWLDAIAHEFVQARFPDMAQEDILSVIGGERGISRGADETAESYAGRLKDAWTSWKHGGTPIAILKAVSAVLPSGAHPPSLSAMMAGDSRWHHLVGSASIRPGIQHRGRMWHG